MAIIGGDLLRNYYLFLNKSLCTLKISRFQHLVYVVIL